MNIGDYVVVLTKTNGHNQCCLFGISVEKFTNYHNPGFLAERDYITLQVLNAYGFSNKDEYVESYPGKCMTDSSMWFARGMGSAENPGQADPYIAISCGVWYKRGVLGEINREIERRIENDRGDRYGIMLMICPTIEEMRKVAGLKSATAKQLWFCSDWKEDGAG